MKRIIVLGVLCFSVLSSVGIVGNIGTMLPTYQSGTVYVDRADVIVIKYRLLNGRMQYRHWNETRGYWVEPDWIYM